VCKNPEVSTFSLAVRTVTVRIDESASTCLRDDDFVLKESFYKVDESLPCIKVTGGGLLATYILDRLRFSCGVAEPLFLD